MFDKDKKMYYNFGPEPLCMNILIGCEFSGIVRDAFIAKGCNAISCDLLPSEREGPHYQGDIRDILYKPWDMLIAFPPCTHLAVSGARWFKNKQREQEEALLFVRELMDSPIKRIAIENPISIISSKIRKPDQIIQPWMFGHGETKATCLWLKGLPLLTPTNIVEGRDPRIHLMAPSENRSKERSRTYQGIAEAMAMQWEDLPESINLEDRRSIDTSLEPKTFSELAQLAETQRSRGFSEWKLEPADPNDPLSIALGVNDICLSVPNADV